MKILITVKELIDKGVWQDFCIIRSGNRWALKEGFVAAAYEFELTKDEAIRYGFIMEEK